MSRLLSTVATAARLGNARIRRLEADKQQLLAALASAEARLTQHRDELAACCRDPVTHEIDDEQDRAWLREEDAVLRQVRAAIANNTTNGAAA